MPSDPINNLPARIATDAADLVAAIAPTCFALLATFFVLVITWRLIREAL